MDLSKEATIEAPTRTSLQIDEHAHVEGSVVPVAYLNHSCNPSAYLESAGLTIRALRDIEPGEEITVNYLASEYDLHTKFACQSGSPGCYGQIPGFRYLTAEEQRRLLPLLSDHLRRKLAQVTSQDEG